MTALNALTEEQRQEVVRLLRAGHSAVEVHRRTGRSPWAVRRIRDAYEIPPVAAGRTPARVSGGDDDGEQLQRPSRAKPWIPPRGYDPFAERHNQRQWLAMLEAATDEEYRRLRAVVCQVLELSTFATDATMARALIADRRPADELAGLYIAARGSGWLP